MTPASISDTKECTAFRAVDQATHYKSDSNSKAAETADHIAAVPRAIKLHAYKQSAVTMMPHRTLWTLLVWIAILCSWVGTPGALSPHCCLSGAAKPQALATIS